MGIVSVPLRHLGAIGAGFLRGALGSLALALGAAPCPGIGGRMIPVRVIARGTGSCPQGQQNPMTCAATTVNPARGMR